MTDLGMTTFHRIVIEGLHEILTDVALVALTLEIPGINAVTLSAPGHPASVLVRTDGAQMGLHCYRHADTNVCRFVVQAVTPDGEPDEQSDYILHSPDDAEKFYTYIARWAAAGLPAKADR